MLSASNTGSAPVVRRSVVSASCNCWDSTDCRYRHLINCSSRRLSDVSSRECTPLHTPDLDVTHVIKSPRLSRSSKVARAYSGEGLGTRLQWGMVQCIHRNGEILDYSVRYSGGGSTQTMPVTGGGTRQTTISGLTPSTDYTIEVAAVNSVGTGPYSSAIVEATDGEYI